MNKGESDCCRGQLIPCEETIEDKRFYICSSCGRQCGVWSKERNTMNVIDKEIEEKITGKNIHSVYHICPTHKVGIDMPNHFECDECKVYLSGEDIASLLSQETQRVRERIDSFKRPEHCMLHKENFVLCELCSRYKEINTILDSLREENK